MKFAINCFIFILLILPTGNLISQPNNNSIKRNKTILKLKNNPNFRSTQISKIAFNNSTGLQYNLRKQNNDVTFSKNLSTTSMLDSTVYFNDTDKRKYHVKFDSNNLIELELFQHWNETGNKWADDFRNTKTYNSEKLLTELLSEYYNESTSKWIKNWRDIAEYSNEGNSELWQYQEWNSAAEVWENNWQQKVTKNNGTITYQEELWDNTLSNWINDFLADINYDDSGNELNYFGKSWDSVNSKWVNSWKDTTFYDNNKRMIGYKSYIWEDEQWYVWDNEVYLYNDDGLIFESMIYDFDYNSMTWIDYQKLTFTYNSNGMVISNFLDNLDDNYFNYRTSFEYDANGNMIYVYNEEVDPVNGSTELITNTIYFSDNFAEYSFDAKNLTAYYSVSTDVKEKAEVIKNNFVLHQNFPNPFNPTTRINYEIPNNKLGNAEPIIIKVFDGVGNEIETLVNGYHTPGSYFVEFDGKDLSSGIYIYQLTSGNFTYTKTMLLLK